MDKRCSNCDHCKLEPFTGAEYCENENSRSFLNAVCADWTCPEWIGEENNNG